MPCMEHHQQHNPHQFKCSWPSCHRWFKNASGCTKHIRSCHTAEAAMRPNCWHQHQRQPSPPPDSPGTHDNHPLIDIASDPAFPALQSSLSRLHSPQSSSNDLQSLPAQLSDPLFPDLGLLDDFAMQAPVDDEPMDLWSHHTTSPTPQLSSQSSHSPQLDTPFHSPQPHAEIILDYDDGSAVTIYHPWINGWSSSSFTPC